VDQPEFLDIQEAAALLRTPPATLRQWRSRGGGPPAARIGKRLLYRRADLIAWVDDRLTDRACPRARSGSAL
jgi:DNA-binding transcriptional MerR regulator